MKTENPIFISVFIKADEVRVATEFDYKRAKEIMVNTLSLAPFDVNTDEGLIFKTDGTGISEAIYNYRMHLNNEPDVYEPSTKQNGPVKVLFECPKCGCSDGQMEVDEDRDIVMTCRGCGYFTIVK